MRQFGQELSEEMRSHITPLPLSILESLADERRSVGLVWFTDTLHRLALLQPAPDVWHPATERGGQGDFTR